MSFSTIYRYFGDKETLLFWFIGEWFKELYPYAMLPLTDGRPLSDGLKECLRRHLEYYARHPKVGRIVFLTVPLERWMRDDSYHQHDVMRLLLDALVEGQKRGELRGDVAPLAMLDAFIGMFNRTFLMWEYRRRKYALVSKTDETFSILWDGMRKQTHTVGRRR